MLEALEGQGSLMILVLVAVCFFVLVSAGIIFVVVGTLRKGKMGVNLATVQCPRCGAEQPRVRKPANARQAMWGGSTCSQCGLEMDKWGPRNGGRAKAGCCVGTPCGWWAFCGAVRDILGTMAILAALLRLCEPVVCWGRRMGLRCLMRLYRIV